MGAFAAPSSYTINDTEKPMVSLLSAKDEDVFWYQKSCLKSKTS